MAMSALAQKEPNSMNCLLCDSKLLPSNGLVLQQCGHCLCRICISQAVHRAGKAYQICCPLVDIGVPCEGYLLLEEIKMVLTRDQYSDWEVSSGYKKKKESPKAQIDDGGQTYNIMFFSDSTHCMFCAIDLAPDIGILLQNCLHIFCSDCLRNVIRNSDGAQILCPECRMPLYDREIKALAPAADFAEYEKKCLQKATQNLPVFRCKTQKCDGFCILDEDNQRRIFLCHICNKQNCLVCMACHGEITCEKYQELRRKAERSGVPVTDEDLLNSVENFGSNQINKIVHEFLGGVPKDNLSLYYAAAENIVGHLKIIETGQDFECLICSRRTSEVNKGALILSQCMHSFCRECLEEVVKIAERVPVACPHNDDNGPCTEFLTQVEYRALASEETLDKHIRWGFKIAQDLIEKKFSCLATNCESFWEIVDANAYSIYICPVCKSPNCVKCNAIHKDLSCDEHQEQLRLELEKQKDDANRKVQRTHEEASEKEVNRLIQSRTFMKCPFCKWVCEKISGCNHVVCGNRACAKQFNWYS